MSTWLGRALFPLIYPLTLGLLLLAVALIGWRRLRAARLLTVCAFALLAIFSSPAVADALLRSLEEQYPAVAAQDAPQAQAIVVLGGAVHIPSQVHRASGITDSTDRVLEAFRLYRAGKAPLILCSGGSNPISGSGRPAESTVMKALLEEWGVPASAILVEDRSLSTRQNAEFSFEMLGARQMRRILLVTSASHMPRALPVFRRAGFDAVPAPADFRTGWGVPDPVSGWMPSAASLDASSTAIKEWIGLAVYRVRGWA